MRREKVEGLVLSRKNIGEADRSLWLFTREHGRVRVIAPGVRKMPSRRGGVLELASYVSAIVSGKDGRYYLGHVEEVSGSLGVALRGSESAWRHAVVVMGSIMGLLPEGEAMPHLYDNIKNSLKLLPQVGSAKQAVIETAAVLDISKSAGVAPAVEACQLCGEATPRDSVVLSGSYGGWRCLSCHGQLAGAQDSITPQALKALKWLSTHSSQAVRLKMDEDESRQMVGAVRNWVAAHSYG